MLSAACDHRLVTVMYSSLAHNLAAHELRIWNLQFVPTNLWREVSSPQTLKTVAGSNPAQNLRGVTAVTLTDS